MEQINALLEKYNHFKFAQIRWIQKLSDTSSAVTLVIEDDDGEETDRVKLVFNGIKQKRILDNSVLAFLDMMSGISIVKEHDLYGFALGRGDAMLHVLNAPMFIVCENITIEEEK